MDSFEKEEVTSLAIIKAVPILKKLSDEEFEQLDASLKFKEYAVGDALMKQGDEGDGFYIIKEGLLKVTRVNDMANADEKEQQIGTLKGGDYCGETALLKNAARGATITVVEKTSAWFLSSKQFRELQFDKKIRFAKRKGISAEDNQGGGKGSNYVATMPQGASKDKDAQQIDRILSAIRYNVLFMNLSSAHQKAVIGEMYKTTIKAGEDAIKQGDQGDNLYVVEDGEFHVFVNETRVAIRNSDTCFGELALMYNSPRAATVRAAQDSTVWVVDRFTFRRVVTNVSQTTLSEYMGFLNNVDLLSPLAGFEREKIAEALEETVKEAGEVIFSQGDEGDGMYLIKKGTVQCIKDAAVVAELASGGYFGERALLKNEPRAATVKATEKVTLLKLDRNAFSLLLGPLEDILTNQVDSYEVPAATAEAQASAGPAATGGEKIQFSDLQVLGTLGKGSFGHVQLVKDKNTNVTYALKAVSKAQIVQTGQQGHIMSEKRAMAALHHPFLIQLFQTYKDQDRLYFLLEPSLGGELFSVLREKTLFDEDSSRFYSAHVVLAFEYMHSLNYVYRDLKPENLLLDDKGYIKVTDFGFAKDISGGRTWTLCGTPDYLAPEIVAGKGHGKGVDWWTLGVFVYEMLASYPPFYDEDPMKTYAKIMHGSITFPSHFSKEAVSIVKKLLYHKATKRLGVVKGGASMIKKHAWYKGFDWNLLLERGLKAPFVPDIKSDTDISNFDDYGDESEEIQPYTDDGTNWEADF